MKQNSNQDIIRIAQKFINFFKKQDQEKRSGEDELWSQIILRIEKEDRKSSRKIYLFRFYKITAVAAALLICFYISKRLYFTEQLDDLENYISQISDSIHSSNQVQILLSETEKVDVDKDSIGITYTSNGEIRIDKDICRKGEEKQEALKEEFNQIIVPKGKSSFLTLSDGTTMNINSDTRVIYPRVFTGKQREIYVEGEIYLNVTKNKEKPFIVKTSKFEVEVLGTSFNVSAYKNEIQGEVVLVHGSVKLRDTRKNEIALKPNNLVTVNGGIAGKVEYVNAEDYIAWTNGLMISHSETLAKIFQKLNRFYGSTIIVHPTVSAVLIDGKLDLKQSLPDLIRLISVAVPIDCQEKNGIYYINPIKN